jgi:hypothetical protein
MLAVSAVVCLFITLIIIIIINITDLSIYMED